MSLGGTSPSIPQPGGSEWCCPREVRPARGSLDHIALAISDVGALGAWCDHLTAIGISHEGIKANIAGQSVDLFDPDGNNIELISER